VRKGLSEAGKRKLSRELNVSGRHLTAEQKQAVIADHLRDTPSISSRAIAAMLGVHHSTVETVRKRMVDGGEISHHDEVEGKNGVHQPARKTIRTAFVPEPQNRREYLAGAKQMRADTQKLRHTVRLAHMEMTAAKGVATAGAVGRKYSVLYADPPWKFGVRSEVTGREKSAENHYPTLGTDEIVELMTGLDCAAEAAVLFLWATNPMLRDALRVLAALGFDYVHHWIWDKEIAGTGYWGRDRHELLLIGRRGDVATPLPGTQPDTVHRERKGRHSAKPEFFAETIERLYPGVPKLELFARTARPDWDAWGFEAGPPSGGSEAPVALSKAEKAGSLLEAAGTRQEAGRAKTKAAA